MMVKLFSNQEFNSASLVPNFENIKRQLKESGVEFESKEFADLEQLKSFDLDNSLVRCDLEFGSRLVSHLAMAPEAVRFGKTFDSISYENGNWLPRLRYFDSLRRRIVNHFGNVEIKESAGLICDSVVRYGLLSVLVSLGFKNIVVFVPDGTMDLAPQLGKYFIGVKFRTLSFSELTQNQDTTSLIVNSIDLEKNTQLMNDMAYFNFMSINGIIVDLISKTPVHPLLFEAEKAGLRVLGRRELVSHYDYESLKLVWSSAESAKSAFLENYLEIETIDQ